MNTTPWEIGLNGYEIYEGGKMIGISNRETIVAVVSAHNALLPFLCVPKLVSEHGLPPVPLNAHGNTGCIVWTRLDRCAGVLYRTTIDSDSKWDDVIAWLPIPPLPPEPDAFQQWYLKQFPDPVSETDHRHMRLAWEAAKETGKP